MQRVDESKKLANDEKKDYKGDLKEGTNYGL